MPSSFISCTPPSPSSHEATYQHIPHHVALTFQSSCKGGNTYYRSQRRREVTATEEHHRLRTKIAQCGTVESNCSCIRPYGNGILPARHSIAAQVYILASYHPCGVGRAPVKVIGGGGAIHCYCPRCAVSAVDSSGRGKKDEGKEGENKEWHMSREHQGVDECYPLHITSHPTHPGKP